MKKVTVVVNKNWETEGVMSALVNTGILSEQLPFSDRMHTPNYSERIKDPHAVFSFKENEETTLLVIVRCIQDAMFY